MDPYNHGLRLIHIIIGVIVIILIGFLVYYLRRRKRRQQQRGTGGISGGAENKPLVGHTTEKV